MLEVKCDGKVMHTAFVKNLQIFDAKIDIEVNKISKFEFSILTSNPIYNELEKISSKIEVYQNRSKIFEGRVIEDSTNILMEKNIVCEGCESYMLDTISKPFIYEGTKKGLIAKVIDEHNEQSDSKIFVGNLNFEDSNIEVSYENYVDTRTRFIDIIENGLYSVVRYLNDNIFVDIFGSYTKINNQDIILKKNLLDYELEQECTDIFTAILPIGKDGLLIGEIDIIRNEEMINKFGYICKIVNYDEINDVNELIEIATKDLENANQYRNQYTVKALDVSNVDRNIDAFAVGEQIKLTDRISNDEKFLMIKKKSIDFEKSANTEISLGYSKKTLTDTNVEDSNTVNKIIKNYVTNEDVKDFNDRIENNTTSIQENKSVIEQNSQNIKLSVENLTKEIDANTSQLEFVSNEIILDKEAIEFIKTTVNELEDITAGKVDSATIQEWARFDGASLELGASNSAFKAILTNTELGFYQNQNKIAWISNNELHILKAIIETYIKIGPFIINYDESYGFTIS